ncbi:MAG TPA: bifunctional demethylmenaquinone methyltransferase/2-methoxy-6-polyprenyl-1,4-benzoquinol methylase UbiE [Verrucomicrobiae bacterium]|nr:bifunctional demethylmenaquinone methyltransferase/2-methoxy-6-polyprenyl-1,4-benzoquinol methylase UbiE [Verrucomicrobiae bacterium]
MLPSPDVTNKFYAAGEQRAARVNDLFDTIAGRYDLINDLQSFGLHRHWKKRLLKLAQGRPGERALDLCCGTGDVAFALARAGLDVVGLDFSEPMLAVAAHRSKFQTPASPVQFLRGDAQHIPFPDASFDVVTISYGLRNLADWETGLREMQRVAKPGGRLLVLDFGKPDNALWRSIYFAYLRWFVPLLGRCFCGDADTHGYILESLKHYAAQKRVATKMEELQLTDVRIVNLMGGIMSINYGAKP